MPRLTHKKPDWLRVSLPQGERFKQVRAAVKDGALHTVCQEARCPNVGECWESGTATFMILGDTCTRGCNFCAVTRGEPGGATDFEEPRRVARATAKMGLDYVVVTSVTRDDLPDGGASIFAATVQALQKLDPAPMNELLTPDYQGDNLKVVLDARPTVFAHNVEVVERLTETMRHKRFAYRRSLACLEEAAAHEGDALTKSSIMLGIGETQVEIKQTMQDLRDGGVSILVLGQYLQPTKQHAPVVEYVEPPVFDALAQEGYQMGFEYVAAGPLVRTSYKAAEAFVKSRTNRS